MPGPAREDMTIIVEVEVEVGVVTTDTRTEGDEVDAMPFSERWRVLTLFYEQWVWFSIGFGRFI